MARVEAAGGLHFVAVRDVMPGEAMYPYEVGIDCDCPALGDTFSRRERVVAWGSQILEWVGIEEIVDCLGVGEKIC